MIYVREPTVDEREELRRMVRQEVGRVSQRAHMVLLSADHRPVPEIARLFAASRATIRFWLRRFDGAGPAGLYDELRSGRPRKITDEVAHATRDLLRSDPHTHGFLATCWTVGMLLVALAGQVTLSAGSLRGLLHQLGLRFGRPRLAMPPKIDPDKAAKQWAIVRAVVEAEIGTTVLYADESRLQLLPIVRAMWHWVGQQVRIPTPGTNVTRAVFGALNLDSGQWSYLIREHMRAEDFLAFLDHLLTVYTSGPIVLIVDNYGTHTAHLVRDWLPDHPRIHLLFLPTYCSHLNPVEARPSSHRGTTWRETTTRSYHDPASRPSARRPNAAGRAPVSGTERAALGDRTARRQPPVCPRVLVRAPRVVAESRRGREPARGKQPAGPVRRRRIAAQSRRAA